VTATASSSADASPEISVVIVTWNSASCIVDCLESLQKYPPDLPYEVIIVDNGSRDDTVRLVQAASPDAETIVNDTNRGLAAANNQGMGAARGRYLVVSNPDVLFRKDTVNNFVDVAKRRPRAAFVIPKLLYPDGRTQTSVGDMPSFGEVVLGRWAVRRRSRAGARSGFWWDGWAHDEEVEVGHGMECCYLVRRDAVDQVGPQDERFRLDWEGYDWSRRMHDAGWQIWFTPQAEVVHLGGVSIKQALPRWVISSHRGIYTYFADRTPRVLRPGLALVLALRAAVKLVGTLRGERLYSASYDDESPKAPPQ
jgi:GT2 family glycosyltransferase